MNKKIGILEGDYIGPEIVGVALKVLDTLNAKYHLGFEYVPLEASGRAYDAYGTPLPAHTLQAAETCAALLKGPFGGPPEELHHPKWSSLEQQAILPLRKHFNLYTNLRETHVLPALEHLSPLKPEVVRDVNILIVRELTSGIYFGPKQERVVDGEREFSDLEVYRESEIRRVAVRAFAYAMQRKKKVTLVAKSNVLKSSVLWREVVREVAQEYPEVASDYMHVDNASMQLILNPRQFDVILTNNIFGDILSDEASVLPGSIGLHPSASIGDTSFGLYEPIHGSAPSIAGKNIANPISEILCIPLMLRYTFALPHEAAAIEEAVERTLSQGYRTHDLATAQDDPANVLGTKEFGDKVIENL